MKRYDAKHDIELFEQLIDDEALTVTHLSILKGATVPSHHHPWHVLVIPYRGAINFKGENGREILKPGSMLRLSPSEEHELTALDDAEVMVVKMNLK